MKPNDQKYTSAHDRISSNPTISTHEVTDGVRQQSLPKLDTPAKPLSASIKQVFILRKKKP
jgi:hypothetical protein